MGVEQGRYIVRARQRSRTALKAFARNLAPDISEVGIDAFQLALKGTWQTGLGRHNDGFTADLFFEALSTGRPEVDWFRVPERRSTGIIIRSRSHMASTLGQLKVEVKGRQDSRGTISVGLKGNPTRTLSHLLAEYGDADDFLHHIVSIDPFAFFHTSATPIARCLGSAPDNWLPDADQALRCLGRDPFCAFLPIFVRQLQALIARLLAPNFSGSDCAIDGCDTLISEPGLQIRLEWGDVRAPQMESYFERHHVEAVAAVRNAALAALDDLDHVLIRRYPRLNSEWVERAEDCLSVAYPLNDRYRLVIYAKSPSRIRFEVRRHGKGDYSSAQRPARPEDRLLAIMDIERRNLLTASPWQDVGGMFDEHPTPQIGDLARLCGEIAEACSIHDGSDVKTILMTLLKDGGIAVDDGSGVPPRLVQALCRLGIVRRVSLRRRDHRRAAKRYALAPEYRRVIEAITLSMAIA